MRAKLTKTLIEGVALVLFAASPVYAHTLGISSGEYRLAERTVHARLAFAVADAVSIVPSLDGDGDRRVSALEATRARADVARAFADRLRVEGDGAGCPPTLTDVAPTEEDGLLVELDFVCADVPREVTVVASFVDALGETHRHVARTVGAATADVLLTTASRRVVFRASDEAKPPAHEAPNRAVFVVGALMAIVGTLLLLARRTKAPPPAPPPP